MYTVYSIYTHTVRTYIYTAKIRINYQAKKAQLIPTKQSFIFWRSKFLVCPHIETTIIRSPHSHWFINKMTQLEMRSGISCIT